MSISSILKRYSPLIIIMGLFIIGLHAAGDFLKTDSICPIKMATGYPCPGCGMTRAHLAAMTFNFQEAMAYHPLFWLPGSLVVLSFFRKNDKLARLMGHPVFWLLLLALVLGVYVYRMWTLFPTQAPMDYLEEGILPRMLDLVE